MIIVISFLLFLLAGIANGTMDSIAHHNRWSLSKFWSRNAMANNKYHLVYDNELGSYVKRRRTWKILWFRINKPVAFCDGWHLSKSVMLYSLSAGAALPLLYTCDLLTTGAFFVILRTFFGAGFYITYK